MVRQRVVAVLVLVFAQTALAQSITLDHQGRERHYLLRAPTDRSGPLPLVLVFHGGSDTPQNMERISGFTTLATQRGFIVAYPEGVQKNWADGRGATPPDRQGIDDVGFTRAVIADIGKRYAIDPKRIYATGPSNGGIFVLRLACEASDVLAAVGPVIGALATQLRPRCKPAAPISVVGIQGTADPLMPFEGGEEGGAKHLGHGGQIQSARATQAFFAAANGCAATPSTQSIEPRTSDGTRVVTRTYLNCARGTEVRWYEIEGGGHRWPPRDAGKDMAEKLARRAFGTSSQNLDATQTVWAFFEAHPKR